MSSGSFIEASGHFGEFAEEFIFFGAGLFEERKKQTVVFEQFSQIDFRFNGAVIVAEANASDAAASEVVLSELIGIANIAGANHSFFAAGEGEALIVDGQFSGVVLFIKEDADMRDILIFANEEDGVGFKSNREITE